jgi:pimeloyl-ACP methyl ester carboxylesterase
MSSEIDRARRRFLGVVAKTVASANFGIIKCVDARPDDFRATAIHTASNRSFGTLKQIAADLLNVSYAEAGPSDGPAVIVLHGWPYDSYSFVDVVPPSALRGYRVIVPYLRGFGATEFLSDKTMRNGQQSVVAVGMIALMDAFKIQKAIVAGFDWGARTANIMAMLWLERCKASVSLRGYLIGNPPANEAALP